METAWLLEKREGGKVCWIGVIDGFLQWTDDPNQAIRLSRRQNGDRLAELVDDTERITEHQWV